MKPAQVSVVMLPLPAQSHLNQLLQLSAHIASAGLPVHFLGSATHNRQAQLRFGHGLEPKSTFHQMIHFHDLPTPPIAAVDPDPNAPDKLPVHMSAATSAYLSLRGPVAELVLEMSLNTTRVVVIYDRLMIEVIRDAVSIPNAEFYGFNCISVFSLFLVLWEAMGKPFEVEGELKKVTSVKEFLSEGLVNFIASKSELFDGRAGDIHNTSRLIEGPYMDLLSRQEISGGKKQWAIRPSISPRSTEGGGSRHTCLDWLDKQAPRSVIYVSFGTTTSFSDEEAMEFAIGLEQSKQKFVWVLRDADKADIFAGGEARKIGLPKGFEEKVKENGLVLRYWVPQKEILAHKSIGGFMSHCGWNSCYESIAAGVPVAAWPIHSDQPMNALFLTEVLKIGFTVGKWEERKEMVKAERIKNVVERLMASEEGDEMRRRAQVLSAAIVESTAADGGESGREFDEFISHISR
ncbi:zeatin O-glucosyltransferase-like [Henckelia pumila]|uniref:zeatin O-glucosyltransferase-like n=1 Tax=Henckelia pumila TaxID=405737 RepID=UPI003C6E0B8C